MIKNFVYRDKKCGKNCVRHAIGVNAAQHYMNQATFHSTFPILVITKIFGSIYSQWVFYCNNGINTKIQMYISDIDS